jgi:hypothetical protein
MIDMDNLVNLNAFKKYGEKWYQDYSGSTEGQKHILLITSTTYPNPLQAEKSIYKKN